MFCPTGILGNHARCSKDSTELNLRFLGDDPLMQQEETF